MKVFKFFLMASVAGCAMFVLPTNGIGGLRKIDRLEECQHFGAGIWILKCKNVSGHNCNNGQVLGGSCQPGLDGVQCNITQQPQECLASSTPGFYNECSTTANNYCPNGIIMTCPNGIWKNKNNGNAACGLVKVCW